MTRESEMMLERGSLAGRAQVLEWSPQVLESGEWPLAGEGGEGFCTLL